MLRLKCEIRMTRMARWLADCHYPFDYSRCLKRSLWNGLCFQDMYTHLRRGIFVKCTQEKLSLLRVSLKKRFQLVCSVYFYCSCLTVIVMFLALRKNTIRCSPKHWSKSLIPIQCESTSLEHAQQYQALVSIVPPNTVAQTEHGAT